MAIEFRCPNGHRLSCGDDRAGRSGKCPKCGAIFRVPEPGAALAASDSAVGQAEIADSSGEVPIGPYGEHATPELQPDEAEQAAGSSTELSHDSSEPSDPSAAEPTTTTETSAKPELIVFLCPNGHKLNCPASLAGRPGKCPHCGATFLVPEYEPAVEGGEDYADEESYDEEESTAGAAHHSNGEGGLLGAEEEDADYEEGDEETGYGPDSFPFDFDSIVAAGDTDGTHGAAAAALFYQLWPHKRTGQFVELHLKGGEVLVPQWFAAPLSESAFGVFAYADSDGSYTVTAIHWDTVERIAVRGMLELPPELFDEG